MIVGLIIATLPVLQSCEDALVDSDGYGSIEGYVLKDSDGSPIARASVTTSPATEAILTEDDGSFEFNEIPTGDYSITIRKSGFERSSVSVSVREHHTARATILLEETSDEDSVGQKNADIEITNWWNEQEEDSIYANAEYRIENTGDVDLAEFEITFKIESSLGSFYHSEVGEDLESGRSKIGSFEKYIRSEEADNLEVYDTWLRKVNDSD